MTDEQIELVAIKHANKTVYNLPTASLRAEMTRDEWADWFKDEFKEGARWYRDNDSLRKELEKLRDEYEAEFNRLDKLADTDDLADFGCGKRIACKEFINRLTQILSK